MGLYRRQPGYYGPTDVGIARLTAGGALDPTFGDGSKVVTEFDAAPLTEVLSATLAPNGRFVVAGTVIVPTRATDFGVARYLLTDGSPLPHVAGAHVFYNNSAFGQAIADDKRPLLLGQEPTFENVTSYTRGINGLVIDLTRPADGTELTADDFELSVLSGVGAGGPVWSGVTATPTVSVQRAQGASGSDRVLLTLPDNAVRNTWLRVTVRANERTGLAADDVFYFGNLVGEVGDTPSGGVVNALDLDRVRATRSLTGVTITNPSDFDRNGRINAIDLSIARANQFHSLPPFTAQAFVPSPPSTARKRSADDSVLESVLATP